MKRERRGNALSWGLGKKKCNVGHDEVLSNNKKKISNNKFITQLLPPENLEKLRHLSTIGADGRAFLLDS